MGTGFLTETDGILVKRIQSSSPKASNYVCWSYGFAPSLRKKTGEIELHHNAARILLVNFMTCLRPLNLQRCKDTNIKWLCFMSSVRWQAEYDTLVLSRKTYEMWLVVSAVAIEQKKQWTSTHSIFQEMLDKPRLKRSMLIQPLELRPYLVPATSSFVHAGFSHAAS